MIALVQLSTPFSSYLVSSNGARGHETYTRHPERVRLDEERLSLTTQISRKFSQINPLRLSSPHSIDVGQNKHLLAH